MNPERIKISEMIVRLLFIAFILLGCDDEFDKTMLNESATPVPNLSSGPAPAIDAADGFIADTMARQEDAAPADARVTQTDATSDASPSADDSAVADSALMDESDAEGRGDANPADSADGAQ